MELLKDISEQLRWHPAKGSTRGVWDRGKDPKPLGARCLWSCTWRIGGKPGQPYAIRPVQFVPTETATIAQLLAELRDVSNWVPNEHRQEQQDRHDRAVELLEKLERGKGVVDVRKFLGKIRENYRDYAAPWQPTISPFWRPGWALEDK